MRTLLLLAALTTAWSACDQPAGREASLACAPAPGAAFDTDALSQASERRHTLAAVTLTDGTHGGGRSPGEEDESRQQLASWALEAATLPLPSSCDGAVPERTALVTYTNGHHFDLLVLQARPSKLARA